MRVGKCGSVTIRLIPAPRGAGIVAARTPKKVLQMAGIEDCYTSSRGNRKTMGNFVKVGALRVTRQGNSGFIRAVYLDALKRLSWKI
jgi:ribosomal protein S5